MPGAGGAATGKHARLDAASLPDVAKIFACPLTVYTLGYIPMGMKSTTSRKSAAPTTVNPFAFPENTSFCDPAIDAELAAKGLRTTADSNAPGGRFVVVLGKYRAWVRPV